MFRLHVPTIPQLIDTGITVIRPSRRDNFGYILAEDAI